MNEFVLFAFLLFTANKTNSFVRFLGESMARPNCFRFYLTFSDHKKFANSGPLASNFKGFCWSLEQFSLTEGQNNFGNKIPILFSSSIWCMLGCWRCLWKFSIRNSFWFFGVLWNLYSLWFLFSDCHNLLVICQRAYSKS